MISDYLGYLREEQYSDNTLSISKRWLEHFFARHPGPVHKLTAETLTHYHQCLQWEPSKRGKLYSESSVNQAVGVLKSYFRWCMANRHLKASPASHIVTRRPPAKEQNLLTPSQARKLLSLPDLTKPIGLRDRAALGLIVEVQASPAALSRLDLKDFQPDTEAILLKSRKRRIVSLGSGLQADLERYLKHGRQGYTEPAEQAFFLSRFGSRMGAQGFRVMLKSYCDRAGFERPSFSS